MKPLPKTRTVSCASHFKHCGKQERFPSHPEDEPAGWSPLLSLRVPTNVEKRLI